MLGLLGIGVAPILGIGMRIAARAATLFGVQDGGDRQPGGSQGWQ